MKKLSPEGSDLRGNQHGPARQSAARGRRNSLSLTWAPQIPKQCGVHRPRCWPTRYPLGRHLRIRSPTSEWMKRRGCGNAGSSIRRSRCLLPLVGRVAPQLDGRSNLLPARCGSARQLSHQPVLGYPSARKRFPRRYRDAGWTHRTIVTGTPRVHVLRANSRHGSSRRI